MDVFPVEIVRIILEYCQPKDYVAALETGKCFHPIDPLQYRRKRDCYNAYIRKKYMIKLGDPQKTNNTVYCPILNGFGEPLKIQTPWMVMPGAHLGIKKK